MIVLFGGHVLRFRERLHGLLESRAGTFGSMVNWSLVALITLTLTATVLESVPRLADEYSAAFELIEFVALTVFSVEYGARLWTA